MSGGHKNGWRPYLKSIGIAVVLSILLGLIFDQIFSKEALDRLQKEGQRSVAALEPFAFLSGYGGRLLQPIATYNSCRANGWGIEQCWYQAFESSAHRAWRERGDPEYDACVKRKAASPDPWAVFCLQSSWIEGPPTPKDFIGLAQAIFWYPASALWDVLQDALGSGSLASKIFLVIQLLIGAGIAGALLDKLGLHVIVNLFLFPIGAVLGASVFALPLKLLMEAGLFLLTPVTAFGALACQWGVGSVTLWKVLQYCAEAVAHHGIMHKLRA
jgi:hypothetical protein